MPTHEARHLNPWESISGFLSKDLLSHNNASAHWDSAPVLLQKSGRPKFSDWNSKPLLFLSRGNLQPSPSINLKNGRYNLWGSLQRNSFSLWFFSTDLLTSESRLCYHYNTWLFLKKKEFKEDRGRTQRLIHGGINLGNGFAVILLHTIFFLAWNSFFCFCFVF